MSNTTVQTDTNTSGVTSVPTHRKTARSGINFHFSHNGEVHIKWKRAVNSSAIKVGTDSELKELRKTLPMDKLKVSRRNTTVEVYDGETLMAKGRAFCWYPDIYNKKVGALHALINATLEMPREMRKVIFRAYEERNT